MTGPFDGLRVLELGRFIAVPVCGQLFAEGGADVIKVEDLDGDQTRHNGAILPFEGSQFLNKNRGKRSLSVELSDPEVIAAIKRITANVDVVLANFRPGLSEQLGFDYESVRKQNPTVIYAENTAYGTKGPMADMPGMDIALQAYTGLMHMTDRGPEPIAHPIIDYATAMLMAWGVSTALYHREKTGRGQKLNVALMHSAMLLENNALIHVDAIDGWRDEFVSYLKQAFAAGKTWGDVLEHRNDLLPHRIMRAYYGIFDTSDGSVAVACNAKTLRLGLIDAMSIDDRWTTEPGWEPDDVEAHELRVREQVEATFRSQTTEHWLTEFRKRKLPIGAARHSDMMFGDEQVRANGFLARVEHEVLGGITVVAPPVHFSETPLAVRPPVSLGKHTRDVLQEAGLSTADIDRLFEQGKVREVHESREELE
jgi:crotonobetainyl-CoA:carnitine CoA-transferase CaiB-like acyl-CoA transferase